MIEIVVLVHALALGPFSLKPIEYSLKKEGYQTVNVNYASRKHNIHTLAEDVYLQIRPYCNRQDIHLNFVTHSMGGIVVRQMLAQYPIQNVGRIVMMAPPNQGSEAADFLQNNFLFRWYFGPAGQQLTTHYALTTPFAPIHHELGIIAGYHSLDPFTYFILPRPHDGKVTVESTKLADMTDHLAMPTTHLLMIINQKVIYQIKYFLKVGKFDHRLPTKKISNSKNF